jgi:chromate transport protein ChrA
MEDELVRRRQWLSREKFLDLLGASNLIPGPSSSELANHIGYLYTVPVYRRSGLQCGKTIGAASSACGIAGAQLFRSF